MAAELYVENGNLIVIRRVIDVLTGRPDPDMTGDVTVYNMDGTALANASALPISYATDAPTPFYYCSLPSTVQLIVGTQYKVVFLSLTYQIKLTKTFTATERTG